MIYLDYQATSPLAPEAREAMLRWLGGPDSDTFGNPHSPHRMGRMAAAAVETARERVGAFSPPNTRRCSIVAQRSRRRDGASLCCL